MQGPRLIHVREPSVGLEAFIALDSLRRGPAFGGVRRRVYASAEAARVEAQRLARAMSRKCALAELPAGGGKTVVLARPELERDRGAAYEALGRAIARLDGDYVCGPDVGTGPAELAALRRACPWVNPEGNDAGGSTARGVLAGLRGLGRVALGDAAFGGRRYVIQGLGAVGLALARALIDAGAEVRGADVDAAARARAESIGVTIVDLQGVLTEPCDVFMPCALGQVLDVASCERGPWRAVCGSANNQLLDREAEATAEVLRRRGIAWAPDFLVNAGAVIEGVETLRGGSDREGAARAIERIEPRCEAVLREAMAAGRSPRGVALAWAEARLA